MTDAPQAEKAARLRELMSRRNRLARRNSPSPDDAWAALGRPANLGRLTIA